MKLIHFYSILKFSGCIHETQIFLRKLIFVLDNLRNFPAAQNLALVAVLNHVNIVHIAKHCLFETHFDVFLSLVPITIAEVILNGLV
jgi:hypothetical protein